jgi:hypothetical protein
MTITYTPGIPNRPNNPSVDQPNMKVNNDANLTIWAVDHVTFNQPSGTPGGTHNHVTFTSSQTTPGLSAGQTQIYPQSFGSPTTYLETYTSATPSSGSQINGYCPFVKSMAIFTTSAGPYPAALSTLANSINVNIASISQTASNTIVITFTTQLPYNSYFTFIDFNSGNTAVLGTTKTTTTLTLSRTNALPNGVNIGFMVI